MNAKIRYPKIVIIGILFVFILSVYLFAAESDIKYTFGFEAKFDELARMLKIISVTKDSPADHAGIQSGDYIAAIDYKTNVVDFLYYVTRDDDQATVRTFSVIRGKQLLELDIQPQPLVDEQSQE